MQSSPTKTSKNKLLLALFISGASLALACLGTRTEISWASNSSPESVQAHKYEKNDSGLTFGSVVKANSPENEPDLILVVATNGLEGYVYKSDLETANGTEAAKSFTSPEQAVRWQETQGLQDRIISVYNVEGKTKIGDFIVGGTLSQKQIASSLGK